MGSIFVVIVYRAIPIIVLLLLIGLCITVVQLILKKHYKAVIGIVVLCSVLVFFVAQSDFIKSRKCVDTDWMTGMTCADVRWRYSCPNDLSKYQDTIQIENKDYHFCVREVFEWNFFDGVLGEKRYYVLTDCEGYITDVYCIQWGGFSPASDYSYWERW